MPRLRPRLRSVLLWTCAAAVLAVLAVAAANLWIVRSTRSQIVRQVDALTTNDVALVLGTSKSLAGGRYSNPFFEGRMDAAATLFREGKVRHLLVSGDNSRAGYDEPSWMRDALIRRGVPADAITLDYAGFRTLDSMARARAVFGLQRITIVTDDFHLARAVFLARAKGLDAIGFESAPVPWVWSKKTRTRELGSRLKAWLDIYVLHTDPKFFGPSEKINLTAHVFR